MNRERKLLGVNSYERELGFSPLAFLKRRKGKGGDVAWLDLCCGSGNALLAMSKQMEGRFVGLDLVETGMSRESNVEFICAPLNSWENTEQYDLVTCVHGLHYIGDKLQTIEKALSWLKAEGLFVAHLDLNNLRFSDEKSMSRAISRFFNEVGLTFKSRKHLLSCEGQKIIDFPWSYLGADDKAGQNFTGQPVVTSYYKKD